MDLDEGVFEDGTPLITTRDVVTDLHSRGEFPFLLAVEGRGGDATWNINALRLLLNLLEWPLNTIVDVVQ